MTTEISLNSDTELAREGYLVLTWQAADTASDDLLLQQSLTADFASHTERAIPVAGAHTLTGLDDGVYYFRAGTADAGWSNTVSVGVQHHSLTEAWGFFTLGLLMFAVLCGVIVRGAGKAAGAQQ